VGRICSVTRLGLMMREERWLNLRQEWYHEVSKGQDISFEEALGARKWAGAEGL